MGDYNLSGLNPREFEHFVQALALVLFQINSATWDTIL
jgi:hypothetical protein